MHIAQTRVIFGRLVTLSPLTSQYAELHLQQDGNTTCAAYTYHILSRFFLPIINVTSYNKRNALSVLLEQCVIVPKIVRGNCENEQRDSDPFTADSTHTNIYLH